MQRGSWQLKRLVVRYCEHGGSSAGVRSYLQSDTLRALRDTHGHLEISVEPSNGSHPVLEGHYIGGRRLPDGRRLPTTVCVRSRTSDEVGREVERLRQRDGNKAKRIGHHTTRAPSVQGFWQQQAGAPAVKPVDRE